MASRINAPHPHDRWISVGAGGLLGCLAIGGLFSLPGRPRRPCAPRRS